MKKPMVLHHTGELLHVTKQCHIKSSIIDTNIEWPAAEKFEINVNKRNWLESEIVSLSCKLNPKRQCTISNTRFVLTSLKNGNLKPAS